MSAPGKRDLIGALGALIRAVDNADDLQAVRRGVLLDHARRVLRRAVSGASGQVPWTPFAEVGKPDTFTEAQLRMIMDGTGCDAETARQRLTDALAGDRVYANSRYQVHVRTVDSGVHLSIKRLDQLPIHDWRDLQRIKDELVGPDCEAVELYPASERLVDTSNQYHLWALPDPACRFDLGFTERLVWDADAGPAAQREFEKEST